MISSGHMQHGCSVLAYTGSPEGRTTCTSSSQIMEHTLAMPRLWENDWSWTGITSCILAVLGAGFFDVEGEVSAVADFVSRELMEGLEKMTIRVNCNTLTFKFVISLLMLSGVLDIVKLYAKGLVTFSCDFGTRYIKKTRVGESIGQEQKLFYEEDRSLG